MSWNLDSDRPIFVQLIEHFQTDMVSGKLKPGERLPSVRELAADASVNPNTMQRALGELERTGLMHSERTSGRYVTTDEKLIAKLKRTLATSKVRDFLSDMQSLGMSKDEIIDLINKDGKEDK